MQYPTQEFNGKLYKLYPKERYFSRGTKRLHRVVWQFYNGPIQKGFHIHHKDGNTHNNAIENLELKSSFYQHSNHMTPERRAEKSEWVKQITHLAAAWHKSPEGKKWHKSIGMNGGGKKKVVHTRQSCN